MYLYKGKVGGLLADIETKMQTINEFIAEYNERVYQGLMPAHNKSVLRQMLEHTDKLEHADKIHGFDDGEAELEHNEY